LKKTNKYILETKHDDEELEGKHDRSEPLPEHASYISETFILPTSH